MENPAIIRSRARIEATSLGNDIRLAQEEGLQARAAELQTQAQRKMLIPFSNPVPGRTIRLVRKRHHVREHLVNAFVRIVQEVATTALANTVDAPTARSDSHRHE